ncbi:MAG: nuclear transport factor 2 family protein [Gammaproteobacteria bacterium]|nr:nuclear transport factor 2 family protein [Gammaproteobacteria bacterium]
MRLPSLIPAAWQALIIALLAASIVSPTAWAGGHKERKPAPKIDVPPEIEAAVIDVVNETAARWNSQDYATLLELWDPDEAFPTYLAEEQAEWFIGWDRLRGYLDPPRPNPVVEAIREEMRDIKVKQIAPDLAIAVWEMHFEMKTIGSNPIGEEVRVSAVLRNTDEGWRYIHWAESPKTAMVYIEDLFEKDVAPGWDEYYKGAQQRKKEVWRKKREASQ